MSIKVALEHRTSYTFDKLVQVYPHIVRLRPAPHSRTPIEAYSLRVEPAEHFINWQQDALGNFLARLVFPKPTRELTITVGLIADLKVINPFDFFIEDWAETWPAEGLVYPKALAADLEPFMRPVDEEHDGSGPGELVQAWVRNFAVPRAPAPSTSSSRSTTRSTPTSPTACGWSPACRPRTTRCAVGWVRAATRRG